MFAKHGFQNVLEKAKVGRYFLDKLSPDSNSLHLSVAERLRLCLEELGPTFIKFGQILSTRPDLIPPEIAIEFKKLQDNVQPVLFSEILKTLQEQFGDEHKIFKMIVEQPLATASIAQVHMAQLHSGQDVVVKIRRPGILKLIHDDLNVLYTLADLLETYVPELRPYNPTAIIDEFFKMMELETNFIVEANNILRFHKNFENDPQIKIPKVYLDFSNESVLVMEMLDGMPLSQTESLNQEGINRIDLVQKGIKVFFKMVFQDRFFHGDLHAGNLFILPENKIGLVDFGVVGRLSVKLRDVIANILVALSQEDYEGLATEFAEISTHKGYIDIDNLARELRDLISPYYGLTFKNINTGRILMDAAVVAARNKVYVPPELMLFFKSVITVEGMGRQIVEDFDLLEQTLVIANEIIKTKYDPNRIMKDFVFVAKESVTLISELPRQLRFLMKQWNQPDVYKNVRLDQFTEFKKSIESSSNLIFLGVVIGSLVLSGSLALPNTQVPQLLGLPAVSTICYGLAFLLGFLAFYNYIKRQ